MKKCNECGNFYVNLPNHLKLKHGMTMEDNDKLGESLPTSTPTISESTMIKSTTYEDRIDKMADRLEKLFYVKILADVVGNKTPVTAALSQLRPPDGAQLEAYKDGIEAGLDTEPQAQPGGWEVMLPEIIKGLIDKAPQLISQFLKPGSEKPQS